ncbi:TetR/AcrR family transcriptional regulator [Paenibacillus sp. WLX1005]|uniref:TetR/AcrR family transcriptional regulator n=1 Tax=Paenibacillus sp. WLX1005 TaxID=3243766 RepID=UPI003984405F
MARKREFDEQQVLEQVMQLFWQQGYEATSMSDLTAATGLQKPSLYAAYGDKRSLFEQALRRYNEQHLIQIQQLLHTGKTAKQSFTQLFQHVLNMTLENKYQNAVQDQYKVHSTNENYSEHNNDNNEHYSKDEEHSDNKDYDNAQRIPDYGCYCLNTLVELAPHDQTFAALTREHQMKLADVFTKRLQQAVEQGEYAPTYDASGNAQILLVNMIGLTVLLKANPDPAFVQHSAALLLSSLLG